MYYEILISLFPNINTLYLIAEICEIRKANIIIRKYLKIIIQNPLSVAPLYQGCIKKNLMFTFIEVKTRFYVFDIITAVLMAALSKQT